MPPVGIIGRNAVAADPTVTVLFWMSRVADSGGLTVRLNVLLEVAPTASVTVTVKVVATSAAPGVPVIAPLAPFSDKPAGSAGVMPKE